MDFSNHTVMVTGGGSGIGLACVRNFLSAGASIVVLDRTAGTIDGPLSSRGDRLVHVTGDVSDAKDVKKAVDLAVEHFGSIDIGINSAGITGTRIPLVDQVDDALDAIFSVNVRGIFLSMKYQLRAMLAADTGGAIINVASVFALRTWETYGLYSATKEAVVGLTKAAALEVAAKRIRVNAVAPGPIRTPFIGELSEEKERRAIATVPAGRLGTPEDVASAITWLASDGAAFVNGEVLTIDGGINAKMYSG